MRNYRTAKSFFHHLQQVEAELNLPKALEISEEVKLKREIEYSHEQQVKAAISEAKKAFTTLKQKEIIEAKEAEEKRKQEEAEAKQAFQLAIRAKRSLERSVSLTSQDSTVSSRSQPTALPSTVVVINPHMQFGDKDEEKHVIKSCCTVS
jgi:hypothetical protein